MQISWTPTYYITVPTARRELGGEPRAKEFNDERGTDKDVTLEGGLE
jgi:hypothetical protein